jgi:hypothetical protein
MSLYIVLLQRPAIARVLFTAVDILLTCSCRRRELLCRENVGEVNMVMQVNISALSMKLRKILNQ